MAVPTKEFERQERMEARVERLEAQVDRLQTSVAEVSALMKRFEERMDGAAASRIHSVKGLAAARRELKGIASAACGLMILAFKRDQWADWVFRLGMAAALLGLLARGFKWI